ncbi:MAG: photosystem II protein Y, partial [Tolypothrix sp. T3-bin4]|nr:photosystem II protein Y [Tolypothrix sp. T3-bin4]
NIGAAALKQVQGFLNR